MGKTPTIKNHYLSRFLSNNFRSEKGKPMYTLNCITGVVTNRKSGENSLFAINRAWGQDLEDSFDKLEDRISCLIQNILHAPLNSFTTMYNIQQLDKEYNDIFSYISQAALLQLAHSNCEVKSYDEKMISNMIGCKNNLGKSDVFLIRFNNCCVKNTPLTVIDNAFTIYISPPHLNEKNSAGSVSFFMPISESYILFFGSNWQVCNFINSFPNPHKINIYRILVENKKCMVASQNEDYLNYLSKEYKYFEFNKNAAIIPKSVRDFR